ncbi:hypothetical protein DPX16_10731 [Anabarilius grahami]|uniref:Uncharacterized protein n=1 Tax=Anabarilius grahami TaxID=495550 RepID=A0A3N0Z8M5_ANAGA|nr:hypothetical protein DPX16_10731 [Anabarilius grahami]
MVPIWSGHLSQQIGAFRSISRLLIPAFLSLTQSPEPVNGKVLEVVADWRQSWRMTLTHRLGAQEVVRGHRRQLSCDHGPEQPEHAAVPEQPEPAASPKAVPEPPPPRPSDLLKSTWSVPPAPPWRSARTPDLLEPTWSVPPAPPWHLARTLTWLEPPWSVPPAPPWPSVSLSEQSRARLPGSGPQKDFAALVEWVLVSNDSPFTVGPAEDDFATSPTPLPEASQPPSTNVTTEMFHVPTADRGGQPTAMDEPGPRKGSDSTIAPEPTSQQGSDQVSEPVTSPDGEGVLVELEGWEESSAHNTTPMETMTDTGKYAEELKEVFMADLIDFFGEVTSHSPDSPVFNESPEPPEDQSPVFSSSPSPEFPVCPPSLPLPPPPSPSLTASSSVPPFLPFSRLTSPTCQMGMSSIFRPSTPSIQEDPLPPLPASTPPAPPRPVDTSASPWLLPPSAPPDTIGHTASPGSLVFPAPPWSVVHLPAPTVPSGSSFPPAPPTSSVPPAQPLPSGCPPPPRTLVTMAPPRSPGPSAARGHIGSAVPSGSPAESPLVVPRVSSAPKLTPPWLLPPATLPWGLVLAGFWGNIWLLLLLASPWLLPPSTPPWTVFVVFYGLFSFVLVLRPPPEPPPSLLWTLTARGRAYPGGGEMLHVMFPL